MIMNPILPGFYPDPSIVRVQEDYYIVNSSFSYYPGVPIFHSKNLMKWEQIGHVLDRPSQLQVTYEMMSAGIFAPTIRYNDGIYYVITTNMSLGCKNFVVTTKDPKGPWSDPYFIDGAEGIDPSLFFDDDGRCYYTGTTRFSDEFGEHQRIWCSEFDVDKKALIGERKLLWSGALVDAVAPEGPHIYKRNGYYYLLIAEGGTEFHHAVTISRSESVMGPYTGCPNNPILTHRHLGKKYPISNVGHGDLVETSDGDWFMVVLGSRLSNQKSRILGRETFIVDINWEDDWPVVARGRGRVEPYIKIKATEVTKNQEESYIFHDDFLIEKLDDTWNVLGTPYREFWTLNDSRLKLDYNKVNIVPWHLDGVADNPFERLNLFEQSVESLAFIGRRLQHLCWTVKAKIVLDMKEYQNGGLVILQNDANQIRLNIALDPKSKDYYLTCVRTQTLNRNGHHYFMEEELGKMVIVAKEYSQSLYIQASCIHTSMSFYASEHEGDLVNKDSCMTDSINCSHLGSEVAGGFVGSYVGLYAFDMEQVHNGKLSIDWFEYKSS